ncbi:MAG: methyl-accepting chemotaxis protein [Rivihabitans pingtungensis]
MQTLVESVRQMGAGDFSRTLNASDEASRNEVDRLQNSLSGTQRDIAGVLRRMADSARALGQVTSQLDQSSDKVMDSSGHQADAAATLARTAEEMANSIGHVSDNASQAEQLAQHTADAAQAGSHKVNEVASEMHQIENEIMSAAQVVHTLGQRTSEINQVIQLIKEVADQTNLLALNAAIEAARAGEQGRGFAVVADEVRKLAERTTQSTMEISSSIGSVQQESGEVVRRIEQVVERIAAGVQAVENAGQVLGEIEAQSKQAVTAVAGIAVSMREQSGSSQSIADSVETIAAMSEANSQACRDNREHTRQLSQLASDLDGMVSRFKV